MSVHARFTKRHAAQYIPDTCSPASVTVRIHVPRAVQPAVRKRNVAVRPPDARANRDVRRAAPSQHGSAQHAQHTQARASAGNVLIGGQRTELPHVHARGEPCVAQSSTLYRARICHATTSFFDC